MKATLAFLGLILIAAPAFAQPKSNGLKKVDCSSEFGLEINPKLDLFDLKVLDRPYTYKRDGYYLSIQSFDTDFEPERKGGMGGMAIISAGGSDLSDPVAGGMVLAKQAAYFDEEMSKALNKKNGKLNAVFLLSLDDEKCPGQPFTITFDKTGLLTLNGKMVMKVMVSLP